MDLDFPALASLRSRAPRRMIAVAVATALVVLSLPSPAAAAPTPSVTISDVTVAEGTGASTTATFTIQVAPRPKACCPLQVGWATAPGSATSPGDFTASSGTVSLTRTTASRIVSVPVVGDLTDEPNETFVVNLSGLVGSPGRIGDTQGIATVTDDDQPPALAVGDVSLTEGDLGTTAATFTIALSAASGHPVTFDWTTVAGSATAGTDFVSASGSRTIVAGASGATVAVSVNGDVLDELDEGFTLTLSDPGNATIGDGSGQATIVDDDLPPTLSISDASVTEGDVGPSIASFDVALSAPSAKTVAVSWTTADDDATEPFDYVAASGTMTFAAGETSGSLAVTVNGDVVAELDEVFRVVLSSPSNATLADASGSGTIVDDELLPVIDIDEPTAAEGSGSVTFSVTLSNPSASPVAVDWSTSSGTAEDGVDYLGASGTVTFAPLDTAETVSIPVNDDLTFEGDETFTVDLSDATGAPLGDPQGIGTIANDDAAPGLSVSDVSVVEANAGRSALTFVVSLTGDTEMDASVDFATADLTALGGSDYLTATGILSIPAGTSVATVDVIVNGDLSYESNETLTLSLSDPTGAVLIDAVAVGTIRNDDKAPTTLTLRITRTSRNVVATGILEPAKAGFRVTATLYRSQRGRFVKVAAKTVRVRSLRDRDGDGKRDGAYTASFLRPRTAGSYRFVVRFKGTSTHTPSTKTRTFKLVAT